MSTSGIDFPVLVRDLRQALGLTQEQLARELSVTFSTVNGWENGRHRPIPALASRLLNLAGRARVGPRPGNDAQSARRRYKRASR
jgi:transcriptional regulator with XRE-family HTH domain